MRYADPQNYALPEALRRFENRPRAAGLLV